jgi:hypothetical protein
MYTSLGCIIKSIFLDVCAVRTDIDSSAGPVSASVWKALELDFESSQLGDFV